ncbi:hypothetical protein E3Q18_00738 [Wallemia mellicola]|nr:hypothetical protein E3Q18_00738 [Wallemia mellicola]
MTEFWNPVYWDNRFRKEREFEWLVSSDCFVEQTKSYIASAKSICNIGCGNSNLSASIRLIYSKRKTLWVFCSYSPYRLESLAGTCNLWTVTHEWSIIAEESSAESNVHRPEIRHYFVALERM